MLVVWLVLGACSKRTADPPVTPVAGSAVRDAATVSPDAAVVADPALVLADAASIVADAAVVSADAGTATAKGSCVRDADCQLVNGTPPNCCSRCRSQAVTRAEAAAIARECNRPRPGDYHDRCPHLSCTCVKEQAVCKSGKCTVESKGC